jgi:hypothetical protein
MEPADEPRGVRAVHSCLLGHGCHVTQSRVLWEAARDDAVLYDCNPYQHGIRNRLASHAAACLDRCRAFLAGVCF